MPRRRRWDPAKHPRSPRDGKFVHRGAGRAGWAVSAAAQAGTLVDSAVQLGDLQITRGRFDPEDISDTLLARRRDRYKQDVEKLRSGRTEKLQTRLAKLDLGQLVQIPPPGTDPGRTHDPQKQQWGIVVGTRGASGSHTQVSLLMPDGHEVDVTGKNGNEYLHVERPAPYDPLEATTGDRAKQMGRWRRDATRKTRIPKMVPLGQEQLEHTKRKLAEVQTRLDDARTDLAEAQKRATDDARRSGFTGKRRKEFIEQRLEDYQRDVDDAERQVEVWKRAVEYDSGSITDFEMAMARTPQGDGEMGQAVARRGNRTYVMSLERSSEIPGVVIWEKDPKGKRDRELYRGAVTDVPQELRDKLAGPWEVPDGYTLDETAYDPERPLAIYGDMLKIGGGQAAHTHLTELSQIPAPAHREVARFIVNDPSMRYKSADDGGRVVVGGKSVAELGHGGETERPRGWYEGATFQDVDGVYSPGHRSFYVGYTENTRAKKHSAAKHEFGHALDDALHDGRPGRRASSQPDWRELWADALTYGNLNPYFKQPGDAGPQEMWAEAFDIYTTHVDDNAALVVALTKELLREKLGNQEAVEVARRIIDYYDGIMGGL